MKEGLLMNKLKYYGMSLGISLLMSIIFLLITATIFTYTSINDRYLNMFVFAVVALSVLIGAMLLLRKVKEKGIFYGILFGLIYLLLIYFFTVIAYRGIFFTNTVGIYALICALSGLVGGIVGVNI